MKADPPEKAAMMPDNTSERCDETREILLDLGLDGDVRRRVGQAFAHLGGCDNCQSAFRDFDQLAGAVKGAPADAVPVGGWEAFERRLAGAARREGSVASLLPRPVSGRWRTGIRLGDAIAACVLVGVVGFGIGRERSFVVAPPVDAKDPLRTDSPNAAEVRDRVLAFRKVNEFFDGQTSWLAFADGASELGLALGAGGGAGAGAAGLVLLRLEVSRGGRNLSSADVVMVPGGRATIEVPARDVAVRYTVATAAADPTRAAISLSLRERAHPDAESSLSTSVRLRPDQPVQAGRLLTPTGEYDLRVWLVPAREPSDRAGSGGSRS